MKIETKFFIDEMNGVEVKRENAPSFVVRSHENFDNVVVLVFDGKSVTVNGRSLIAATENAMNKGYRK